MSSSILIFEYDDYREYLRDMYAFLKAKKKGFSFRNFSRQAGFKSTNILKLVMEGQRNLAPDSIEKFAKALHLNREEANFFHHLVLFNQAKASQAKEEHARELLSSRSYRKIFPIHETQLNFLSNWYYIPIWELVGLPGFQEDPEWIAKRICPPIYPSEAKLALRELLELGLLKRDGQGRLLKTMAHLSTDKIVSANLSKCHKELISRASESIDRFPREQREISAHTFKFSERSIAKIKEIVQKFRSDVLEIANQENSPDMVCQLNVQFFPIALAQTRGSK